jgi:hypothetical protein
LDERLEQSNAASVCPQTDSATTTTTTTISVPNWRPPYSIPLHSSPHQIPSLPSLSIPCTAPTHNAATCEPRQRIRQVHQPLVFSLFYKKYLLNYLGLVPLYIYIWSWWYSCMTVCDGETDIFHAAVTAQPSRDRISLDRCGERVRRRNRGVHCSSAFPGRAVLYCM